MVGGNAFAGDPQPTVDNMKSQALIDRIFNEVEAVVLARQHPVTGLLPASTSINTHGDYTDAWVRDNVYSIMCVWALGLAYRKRGEKVRCDQLEQATIKLMRGLLEAMMRQAAKVEVFKHTLNPGDALHAKYDTATGLPVVADDAWGHLQIDATSLFLLLLGQISASGVRIVFTYSEVDFVQNLIYYIASAYRTPDFGIWERGNKINNGKTEINASSLGMAKAALQALDGFNLFGKNASPRAVVHTVADSISQARATLASLLPRESMSKEVDSALLSIVGFPAFAVGDDALASKTRDKILNTLGGKYGCKRFIWDGHQTALEDSSRLYYEHTELANFENIESEWPLFFTFLYIDALFNENEATASHYRDKLEKLMVYEDGVGLIPELFYLPQENIAAEKKNPRSQQRVPNENVPLVWAQSLYLTGLMIDEGLLEPADLDKLELRHRSTRFVQPQIALVVLAENEQVKETLIVNGVIAETVDEIRPIGVISAPHLVDAYAQVGANSALGLSGRPPRRLQSLSTSQSYEINGDQFLCLSWIQGSENDYRSYDAKRVAYKIEREFAHIRKHWLNTEVAVFTFMVEQRTCDSPAAATLFQTLRDFQLKNSDQRVGYASAKLAYRASRRNKFMIPNVCITPMHHSAVYRDKTLPQCVPDNLIAAASAFIVAYDHAADTPQAQADQANFTALKDLVTQFDLDQNMRRDEQTFTLRELLKTLYLIACQDNHWMTARFCFQVLGKVQDALADGVVLLASRHLSVVLGTQDNGLRHLDAGHGNAEIINVIRQISVDPFEQVLTQEALTVVGSLVRTSPHLFDGLRSIYLNNLLALCAVGEKFATSGERMTALATLSPSEFLLRLLSILQSQRQAFTRGIEFNLALKDGDKPLLSGVEQAHAVDTDWLQWRSERGLFPRFDESFLKDVWRSLRHAKVIIFGDVASEECALDTEVATRSMTAGEESFARLIDQYTQQVHPPYFKCAVVETLYAFTQYCLVNAQADFGDRLDLSAVLEAAAEIYVRDIGKVDSLARNMDLFIEQSPSALQKYARTALQRFDLSAHRQVS